MNFYTVKFSPHTTHTGSDILEMMIFLNTFSQIYQIDTPIKKIQGFTPAISLKVFKDALKRNVRHN